MNVNEYFIIEKLQNHLPPRRVSNGWQIFNCPVCHLHGEPSVDTNRKGNIIFSGPTFTFRCWRCKFKCHWRPGMEIKDKLSQFFLQLGFTNEELTETKLFAIQLRQLVSLKNSFEKEYELRPEFERIELPSDVVKLSEGGEYIDDKNFQKVVQYVQNLGEQIYNSELYWSPEFKFNKRFIIPFYFQNQTVGYTARYCDKKVPNGFPKYITNCHEGYLFNNHFIDDFNRKYIVIVEGPIDALAINGVAYLKDSLGPKQINWLKNSGKEIILLPDRGKSAKIAIDQAIENKWYVSMPPEWDRDIKDAHDAYLKYGALYTVECILDCKMNNEAAINQFWKKWR